jgi:hypothetical protein
LWSECAYAARRRLWRGRIASRYSELFGELLTEEGDGGEKRSGFVGRI